MEELYPNIHWDRSHRLSRDPGLTPQQSSFLFLLKNDLLVTRERQFRLKKVPDPNCVHCGLEDGHTHILSCPYNSQVTLPLLLLLNTYHPNIIVEQAACLDWEVEGMAAELIHLVVTAISFDYVWMKWKNKKHIE